MISLRKASRRGRANYGWLQSAHTFSFGSYFEPNESGFSDLLVINDDRVSPGMGFGSHSHRDMEIFSYVLEGALAHEDSLGTGSTIQPGEIQLMSAGRGIVHSEFNASKDQPVHFLQIWIIPARSGQPPRYQQRTLDPLKKRGRFALVLSPQGDEDSLVIDQDARVYAGEFDGEEEGGLVLPPNRYAYVHLARGAVELNGTRMEAGDGARLIDESELHFSHGHQAEVLVFDLRPNMVPKGR